MADIPHIALNDGRTMPQLGLGVLQMPARETEPLVCTAIDLGYPAVDTAMIYGNEGEVGRAIRSADRPIFVTTKLWIPDMGPGTVAAFGASMDRLGLDHVDLYLIHWPAPARGDYVDTWRTLVRLAQDDSRLRSIGVSNFRIEDLRAIIDATGVVPAVNQIELHPRFQQRALRDFHAEHGIATTSWSPLGRGSLLDDPVLVDVAARHGKSPAQIVIRWHVQSGLVVIPKSANQARLAENIDVFDFALDDADMARIAILDRSDGRSGPDPAHFSGMI